MNADITVDYVNDNTVNLSVRSINKLTHAAYTTAVAKFVASNTDLHKHLDDRRYNAILDSIMPMGAALINVKGIKAQNVPRENIVEAMDEINDLYTKIYNTTLEGIINHANMKIKSMQEHIPDTSKFEEHVHSFYGVHTMTIDSINKPRDVDTSTDMMCAVRGYYNLQVYNILRLFFINKCPGSWGTGDEKYCRIMYGCKTDPYRGNSFVDIERYDYHIKVEATRYFDHKYITEKLRGFVDDTLKHFIEDKAAYINKVNEAIMSIKYIE